MSQANLCTSRIRRSSSPGVFAGSLVALMTVMLAITPAPVHAEPALAAAVLPNSRSVEVGQSATLFATLLNAGTLPAEGCTIELAGSLSGSFSFQTTDPLTNAPTGEPNMPVDVAAGGAQTFVLTFTPDVVQETIDVVLDFMCTNAASPAAIPGVNTFSFSASDTPVPDIIALVATLTNNGVVELPDIETANVFSVASINVGAAGSLTVSADTGGLSLPLTVALCETDPVTSVCVNPTTPTTEPVSVEVANQASPTFGVFVTPSAEVPLDPAVNRVSVRFFDDVTPRGATSVAVQTLPEDLAQGLMGPLGGTGADGEYSQFSDSPFARLDFSGGYFYLEDFEREESEPLELRLPGASASPGSNFNTLLFGPRNHDSVDFDDGTIDGFGLAGESWFVSNASDGVTWTFDAEELGGLLPTYVGLVWTDGVGDIAFEAFDANGDSLGTITGAVGLVNGAGATEDDRFYGAVNFGGISAIKITTSTLSMEIDHLQWGRR